MNELNADVATSIATGFSHSRAERAATARKLAGDYYQQERDSIYRYLVSIGTNRSETVTRPGPARQ